jgi:hypothetical protein
VKLLAPVIDLGKIPLLSTAAVTKDKKPMEMQPTMVMPGMN